MAALVTKWNLYQGGALRARVAAAVAVAQAAVRGENPITQNHANRMIWANKAVSDVLDAMLWAVCQNDTIADAGESATDNDILFVVNSSVNGFAVG